MRRFLCIILSLFLVITSGAPAAYAAGNKSRSKKSYNMGELKGRLKQYYKDKDKAKKYIREIVTSKREDNNNSIIIFINGEEIEFDTAPVIKNGRALIPIRAVADALGAKVEWNAEDSTAAIIKNTTVIKLRPSSDIIYVNKSEVRIDVPAEVINGRLMIPLRAVAEIFKMSVDWDDTGAVIINDDDNSDDCQTDPTPTPRPTPTPTPAPVSSTRYEAEEALLSGGASIDDNHRGYSGDGFVNGYWNKGAAASFTVDISNAGNHNVTLRYANGAGSNKTLSIYVNGTKIKTTTLPYLANWDTWGSKTEVLSLRKGENTITYKYDTGDTGNVNLDYITIPSGGYTISASSQSVSGNVSLSSQGTLDWVHWGLDSASGFTRKSGVSSRISNFTRIGSNSTAWFADNPVSYSWTGGTPVSSVPSTTTAVYMTGEDNGFEFTVDADMAERTLKVYVGAWKAKGKFEVFLNDNSTAAYTGYIDSPDGIECKAVTVNFKAASGQDNIKIKYTVDKAYGDYLGNITLQAAVLR